MPNHVSNNLSARIVQPNAAVKPGSAPGRAVPQEDLKTSPAQGSALPPEGQAYSLPQEEVQQAEAIAKSVSKLNQYVQDIQRELHFSVDKESNQTVIKVLDRDSGEVIRQIPAEEALQLARRLEDLDGLLVREEV